MSQRADCVRRIKTLIITTPEALRERSTSSRLVAASTFEVSSAQGEACEAYTLSDEPVVHARWWRPRGWFGTKSGPPGCFYRPSHQNLARRPGDEDAGRFKLQHRESIRVPPRVASEDAA